MELGQKVYVKAFAEYKSKSGGMRLRTYPCYRIPPLLLSSVLNLVLTREGFCVILLMVSGG